jgi:hypothetical protein
MNNRLRLGSQNPNDTVHALMGLDIGSEIALFNGSRRRLVGNLSTYSGEWDAHAQKRGGCLWRECLIRIFSARINANSNLQLTGHVVDVLEVAEINLDLHIRTVNHVNKIAGAAGDQLLCNLARCTRSMLRHSHRQNIVMFWLTANDVPLSVFRHSPTG